MYMYQLAFYSSHEHAGFIDRPEVKVNGVELTTITTRAPWPLTSPFTKNYLMHYHCFLTQDWKSYLPMDTYRKS